MNVRFKKSAVLWKNGKAKFRDDHLKNLGNLFFLLKQEVFHYKGFKLFLYYYSWSLFLDEICLTFNTNVPYMDLKKIVMS